MEIGLLSWLLFGVVSAVVARKKGRGGCAWFALGVLLGPFGLILAFAASPKREQGDIAASKPGALRKCPSCAKLIQQEAVKCRFCGRKVSGLGRVSPGVAGELWTCPRCGASNAVKSYRCGNCGYSVD
jgi:hypothetical protein